MNKSENEALTKAARSAKGGTPLRKRRGRGFKRLCIIVLTIVIVLCVTLIINDVLRQKWNYDENAAQQIVQGYYKEAPNTLDVLCLGASTVRNGVSGLEMYNEYGFTTYSRASSIQLPVLSYYLLEETLEKHDLKAVIMDASTLSNQILDQSPETMAGKMHEVIDYMPWSKYKWNMAKDCIKLNSSISMLDFLAPLYAYHDRWTDIDKEDFTYREWQSSYCYKGQFPAIKTVASSFDDDYMSEDEEIKEVFYLDENLKEYCARIIDLCRERGIVFVLVKTPGVGWNVQRQELIRSFAQEQGVPYIDYNDVDILEEIGFDARTDFVDQGKHLNITGAKKISSHLGAYLVENCDFEDKRQNPAYQSWNEDYAQYARLLEDAELLRETNLIGFLNKLDNPNYIAMISARNDVSKFYNDEVNQAFAALGIEEPFAEIPYLSYLALLDGGKVVYQQADENPDDNDNRLFYSTEYESHSIQISSLASPLIDNESSIVFDGEELSPSGWGFNIAVYDKSVGQFVVARAFNTGKSGRDYNPPNPFADYTADPLGYLDLLANDDYITVMAVAGEGSRYMPGVVNDKLAGMGLIPLDGEFYRPYLAILNGSEVVCNEYGKLGTEINEICDIEGIPVTAVSNTSSSNPHAFIAIGEDAQVNQSNPGLTICVYSKSQQRRITLNRFDWSNNYTAEVKVAGKTNVLEILDAVKRGGYDALCLYTSGQTADAPSDEVLSSLREYGFERLEAGKSYAGIVRSDGTVDQEGGEEPVRVEAELGGMPVRLLVENGRGSATFGGVEYAAPRTGGLYLFAYDGQSREVLSQAYVDRNIEPMDNPFADYGADPLGFLELLNNDDYITVMAVAGEGSRYMPGVVNDKLAGMGLIPLDGGLYRPYLAVLNGSEVVCNEYGEVGTEINASCTIEGISVTAVSNTSSSNAHAFIAIGDDAQVNQSNPGLTICVYSKSQRRRVTLNRFDWSNNYTAEAKIAGKTNVLEILDAARRGGYDALCLYAPGDAADAPSEEVLTALREYGFERLEAGKSYAGIVRSDSSVDQEGGEEPVRVEAELGGTPVTLLVENGRGLATFGGVEYAAPHTGGLYLFTYDARNRAVLSQAYVDRSVEPVENPFEEYGDDPLRYLDLLENDDYITVMTVAGTGSRYMPGVVNDKLREKGLIPLDGEFNRPYIAVLDGSEVIRNEYGDPGTELNITCEVEGVPVSVVSSALPSGASAFIAIGDDAPVSHQNPGLTICVYSKSQQRRVSLNRFDWSNNYTAKARIAGKNNVLELLDAARRGAYDVLCLYVRGEADEAPDAEVLAALREYGFGQLDAGASYAGIVRSDGDVVQESGEEPVRIEAELGGTPVTLLVENGHGSAKFWGVEYPAGSDGVYLYVYDTQSRAVLTQSRVDRPEAAAEPFKGLSENPLEYLDALADDDFITVIYANVSGSRFMPWVVNDKLSKMGLIPLDGTFDRPYIAVLDGAEVVANEYGQVGEEISVRCEVDGTEVVVISDAHADKRSGYISVGETEVKRQPSHVGPTFYVYSKSRKERISFARFDWSKDYLSRTGISGVDNPLELLTIARHGGYDVLCASNAASGEGEADADAMAMLRDFGFTELEGGAYYAGVLRGDGSVEQQSRMELASLELDLEGVPAALYAGDGVCRAGFYGAVEYASDQPGIHLYVYDPKNRAVLTEICYANK